MMKEMLLVKNHEVAKSQQEGNAEVKVFFQTLRYFMNYVSPVFVGVMLAHEINFLEKKINKISKFFFGNFLIRLPYLKGHQK